MYIPPMQPRDNRPAGDRCEVTLRDTFAAAALTGLTANGDYSVEATPILAYRMADAMLRERAKTNHDASPEATATADRYVRRAAADGGSDRTDKAAPRPSEGTGDTPTSQPTLTDEEREAIQEVIDYLQPAGQRHQNHVASILRGLLERASR